MVTLYSQCIVADWQLGWRKKIKLLPILINVARHLIVFPNYPFAKSFPSMLCRRMVTLYSQCIVADWQLGWRRKIKLLPILINVARHLIVFPNYPFAKSFPSKSVFVSQEHGWRVHGEYDRLEGETFQRGCSRSFHKEA
jgi:hypothetical protein